MRTRQPIACRQIFCDFTCYSASHAPGLRRAEHPDSQWRRFARGGRALPCSGRALGQDDSPADGASGSRQTEAFRRSKRSFGPPLQQGRAYALAIGAGMLSADGTPLSEPFRKLFFPKQPSREAINTNAWRVTAPAAGSSDPVIVEFGRALDQLSLRHAVRIASPKGTRVLGCLEVLACETSCRFQPEIPWAAGIHAVEVSTELEDCCGNSVIAPFDRPMRKQIDAAAERQPRRIQFLIA